MPDELWIKNLAAAQFQNGKWTPIDQESIDLAIRERLSKSLDEIYTEALETCDLINFHLQGRTAIKVLPLKQDIQEVSDWGLVILLGNSQLRFQYKPKGSLHRFEEIVSQVRNFKNISNTLHVFIPHASDDFGTLVWNMDGNVLMHRELVVKRFFEDLMKAGYENGDLG